MDIKSTVRTVGDVTIVDISGRHDLTSRPQQNTLNCEKLFAKSPE